MVLQLSILFLSFLVLYLGAEFTLSSAEKIGRYFGIPSLIVGLLIIGFGTSLPELFVSQLAAFRGHPEIALGNIIGSNISNIFLILGISALFVRFKTDDKKLFNQLLKHFVLTIILAIILSFEKYYLTSSLVLLAFFTFYLYTMWSGMKKHKEERESDVNVNWLTFLKLLVGFVLLYFGGELLVSSGSKLGKMFGVSEYVISAILVAFGTSLPELITSIIACVKKYHSDVIIGNVIGSNIFNVALVLGSLGVYKIDINMSFVVEMSVLLFVSVLFLVLSKTKVQIGRLIGSLFIATYISMVIYWI